MLAKLLTNLINNFNKLLSTMYLNNTNIFTYNVFSVFYKIFIFNKIKIIDLNHFFEEGYQKFENVKPKLIEKINIDINKQNLNYLNNSLFRYETNKEIEDIIKIIIKKFFLSIIQEIEDDFHADMKLSYVRINRNHGYLGNEEEFSNYFHNDGYILTLIKFFKNF